MRASNGSARYMPGRARHTSLETNVKGWGASTTCSDSQPPFTSDRGRSSDRHPADDFQSDVSPWVISSCVEGRVTQRAVNSDRVLE